MTGCIKCLAHPVYMINGCTFNSFKLTVLIDFSNMGGALFKSLYGDRNPKVALLNVGQEVIKGKDTLKKALV